MPRRGDDPDGGPLAFSWIRVQSCTRRVWVECTFTMAPCIPVEDPAAASQLPPVPAPERDREPAPGPDPPPKQGVARVVLSTLPECAQLLAIADKAGRSGGRSRLERPRPALPRLVVITNSDLDDHDRPVYAGRPSSFRIRSRTIETVFLRAALAFSKSGSSTAEMKASRFSISSASP